MTLRAPAMLATASSTRLAICVSSSLGATPGSVTVTDTIGRSMFGKRVIGRLLKLMMPSAHSTTNSRIGRQRIADRPGGKVHFTAPVSLFAFTGVTWSPSAMNVPARSITSSPSAAPSEISTSFPLRIPIFDRTRFDDTVLDDLQE